MNFRDLEYLVALAKHKHFRHAAEACHVSQPTLSGQLRKLEQELGVSLVERSSRKVLFTEMGMQLVQQAQQVLLEAKKFSEMASAQHDEMSGPLRVGLIPTVGPYLLPRIVILLRERFPQLELFLYEAQTHQLVEQLASAELDCLILASVKETQHFSELSLYREPMLLALPSQHPLAKYPPKNLSELAGESLLMLSDGHCLRDQALGFCFSAGAGEDSSFQATSLETLRNMVAAGGGMTLLPELAISQHPQPGIEYLRLEDPQPFREIVLAYRPGSALKQRYQQLARVIGSHIQPQLCSAGKGKDG
ncbi:DNA-binding transcriptional regulator OxyR [Dongshaea marina]|uniref:DNA-binding transcriptional regulator OxyR n=1 Tax=Dongshaea marina TaxID=2047966 RepID=UPI000D3E9C0C|nr:DNA-binding transcriptional regulator OxyR [Dongshaea marina]